MVNQNTIYSYDIIIWNDGSSLDYTDIITKYNVKNNITVFKSENEGLFKTLNKLLDYCKDKYDYLLYCDADDICLSNRVQTQLDLMLNHNLDFLCCSCDNLKDNWFGYIFKLRYNIYKDHLNYNTVLTYFIKNRHYANCFLPSASCFRTQFLIENNIKWNINYKVCADFELVLQILLHNANSLITDDMVVKYTQLETSWSNSQKKLCDEELHNMQLVHSKNIL